MKIKAKITFRYQTGEQARISLKSLQPDNSGFIESYRSEKCVICKLSGDSLRTILATADDLLFGEMMVEKVLDMEKEPEESYNDAKRES